MKRFVLQSFRLGLAGLLGLLALSPAYSHHSAAMFDHSQVREMEGVVKEFQFTNPHTWLQVLVEDENGQQVEWSLEWHSPNQLGREGIRPTTFPPGERITVRTNPMLDGSAAGMFLGARLADGQVIGHWQ